MLFTEQENLITMVETAPVGICILNADTFVVELFNSKFLEIAGIAHGSIHGQFYRDAFPAAGPDHEAALAGVVKTNTVYSVTGTSKNENIVVIYTYTPIAGSEGIVTKVAVWLSHAMKPAKDDQQAESSRMVHQRERDRLKRFLMQAPAAICILDGPELVYELVNPLYQEFLPGRDVLGRPIFEALPELVGTPLEEILQNVYSTGKSFVMNELLVPISEYEGGPTRDRYFTFTYQARFNDDGHVDGILVFAFDVTGMITVQKQVQQAREQAEQQKRVYETITSGTPDLMYVFDLEYKFTYVNSALLSMWGKTWENAIGKNLLENGYEPWHATMHEREIDQIKKTKQPFRGEVSFPHALLGRRIYDYILTPVFNEEGEVEAVAGVTRDITERKQWEESMQAANEELKQVNQQLLEAEEKLRMATESGGLVTWFLNEKLDKISASSKFNELFGFEAGQEVRYDSVLAQIYPEYLPQFTSAVNASFTNGAPFNVDYPINRFNDGELRWIRSVGKLILDENNGNYITGVMANITEQKADDIRKSDFISMVSHELKTPLTSLSALVQIANSKLKGNEDHFLSGAMEKAHQQVRKMTTMINGFLNVSRLESGKIFINKQDFDLEQLLLESIEDAKITLPAHDTQFSSGGKVLLHADRDKIGSVISNFISNAVKYSSSGKGIEVKSAVNGSEVVVSVKDEGIGISADDLEKIFDRYYRVETNTTQLVSGFGIGLYLSSEIIHRHGGRVWAESQPGIGSTFYFALPLQS